MAVEPGVFHNRPGGGGTVLILNRAAIDAFALPGGMTYRFARDLGIEVEEAAKAELYTGHGYDTGEMERSIASSATPGGPGITLCSVRASANHSLYYHEGTLPHTIRRPGVYGRPLVFYWDKVGRVVSFPQAPGIRSNGRVYKGMHKTHVNHPEFRGHPFLVEAMRAVLARRRIT